MFKKHKFKFLAALIIILVTGGAAFYFKKKADKKKAKEAIEAIAAEKAAAERANNEPFLAAVEPRGVKQVGLNSSLSKSTPMKTAIKPLSPTVTTKK